MKPISLLVAHPWMGRGGSEATAMWTLDALQDEYEVSFVSASSVDLDLLNGIYGSSVDADRVRVLKAPALPGVDGPMSVPNLQQRYFGRFCHRIARKFDLCVSAYNPVPFGRPAIHLVGDFSFSEKMRKHLADPGNSNHRHRDSLMRKTYLGAGRLIGVRTPPLADWEGLVIANSEWTAELLDRHFGIRQARIIYPPVTLPTVEVEVKRNPFGFVSIGRIVPEKNIERIIAILKKVRNAGFPVTLHLAGNLEENEYGREIARKIEFESDWILTTGFLDQNAKQTLLSGQSYALHGCRIEAFGIAVAEMASMGCIPFVPATGGAREIVPFPELHYETDEDAVAKIVALL